MFCGFTMGGALGGLSATALVTDFGWQGVLILGGALPLVLVAVLLGPVYAADGFIGFVFAATGPVAIIL